MERLLNPCAVFDALFLGQALSAPLGYFTATDVQTFSYLACLLTLYKKRPVSDWEYFFAGTKYGAPFSTEIQEALEVLENNGLISSSEEGLKITNEGREELTILQCISQNRQRTPFLDGASACLAALPPGVIRDALSNEPELSSVRNLRATRGLLLGSGLTVLYDQFDELSSIMGIEIENLTVPALTWLSCLYANEISQSVES